MSIKCVGCDTPIPEGATRCPMCGAPVPAATNISPPTPQLTEVKQETYIPVGKNKKCSSCAMLIPKEASVCPFCRSQQKSGCLKVVGVIFLGAIVATCIGGINSENKSSTSPSPPTAQEIEQSERYDAKYMAKEFVTGALKAPSTAKFPSYNDFAAAKKNGQWEVLGYVDAQNSYGAMLRQQFLCTLIKNGDRWILVDLKMPY